MKKISKKTWIIFAVVIIVVVGVIAALSSQAKISAADTFQTAKIERGNLTATVGATGTVRSNQSALLNWQTSGTVEQVSVAVGDRVGKGLTLASLESTSLSQGVILAQADLVSAEKSLDDLLQ